MNIHPIHWSVGARIAKGRRVRPQNMTSMRVDRDLYEGIQAIAMAIFADCTNVGVSFQEALTAIYVSGLQHGQTIASEGGE